MGNKKYYLHRISHEGNASYSLLDMNYLTLGWSEYADTDILQASREPGYPRFEEVFALKRSDKTRSRWNMWYFAQIEVGDVIIVPLYDGLFSAYEAVSRAKPIGELQGELDSLTGKWSPVKYVWKNDKLYDDTSQTTTDIGFFITVKEIVKNVPRDYVEGPLVSRLKIRGADADISDISEYVERGIKAGIENKPITLYESTIEALTNKMKEAIQNVLDDSKFEKLIKWYLNKCGADSVIPAKNEQGKENGADADTVAVFENLKHIVYVQAKHHTGQTSDWAVTQIKEYKDQKSGDPDYTYASWVITSADDFSLDAKNMAYDSGIRLINGQEFARMLLDIGLLNLDDAFK